MKSLPLEKLATIQPSNNYLQNLHFYLQSKSRHLENIKLDSLNQFKGYEK